jgi:hypothetical protein
MTRQERQKQEVKMLGEIAHALATYYGYKTLGGLLSANSGLIIVLAAFICVTLVFLKILSRQYPGGNPPPFRQRLIKTTVVFFICAFIFVCGFTVFYEKKKAGEQSALVIPAQAGIHVGYLGG